MERFFGRSFLEKYEKKMYQIASVFSKDETEYSPPPPPKKNWIGKIFNLEGF
jgi:hypothetical protein